MEIRENVYMNETLRDRAERDTLTASEKGKLTLANLAAELLPEVTVYLESEPQGVDLHAVFIGYYEQVKRRKLKDTARYELGFEITYIPADPLSKSEKDHAAWTLLQNITDIPGYAVQQVAQKTTSEYAQITGTLIIWEANEDSGPIIQQTDKEIKDKPPLIIDKTESEVKP